MFSEAYVKNSVHKGYLPHPPPPATHTCPPGQTPPLWVDTPWEDTHLSRHRPVRHPLPSACWDTHPLPSTCWDTVNKQEVHILLEYILVTRIFCFHVVKPLNLVFGIIANLVYFVKKTLIDVMNLQSCLYGYS